MRDALAGEGTRHLPDLVGPVPIDLDGPRGLVDAARRQEQRPRVAFQEAARVDHLGDVDAGPEPPADRPERVVRHAGHRRQHDRRPGLERTELQGPELARTSDGHGRILFQGGTHRRSAGVTCARAAVERVVPGVVSQSD